MYANIKYLSLEHLDKPEWREKVEEHFRHWKFCTFWLINPGNAFFSCWLVPLNALHHFISPQNLCSSDLISSVDVTQ